MRHDVTIRDACEIAGLTRAQINHMASFYGMSFDEPQRLGEARRFSKRDLVRLALAEKLSRIGIPWPTIVAIDSEMPQASYDTSNDAWLLAGWVNGHPDPELVRVVTPQGARRAMSANGLHTGVLVNLSNIEGDVRTRLEKHR